MRFFLALVLAATLPTATNGNSDRRVERHYYVDILERNHVKHAHHELHQWILICLDSDGREFSVGWVLTKDATLQQRTLHCGTARIHAIAITHTQSNYDHEIFLRRRGVDLIFPGHARN